MAPAYLVESFVAEVVAEESFVAEAYLDIVGRLLGFVGNSLGFENYHSFGFGVEGYSNFGLDVDCNFREVAELSWNSSINCCC